MVVTQNALLPNEPSDVHFAKAGLRPCATTLVLSHLGIVGRGPLWGPKGPVLARSGHSIARGKSPKLRERP
jgi:hypothetical protein